MNEKRFELKAEYFKAVEKGDVDWAGWIDGLDKAGYDGWISSSWTRLPTRSRT